MVPSVRQMQSASFSEGVPAIGYLISLVLPVRVVMSKRGKEPTADWSLRYTARRVPSGEGITHFEPPNSLRLTVSP